MGGETRNPLLLLLLPLVLQAVVAALSRGPVGFADELLRSDPAVLWPTTTLGGTLLHPGRPATTLDGGWAGGPMAGGDVRSAHSALPCVSSGGPPAVFHSLLAAGEGAPSVLGSLTAAQLWPRPTGPHWVWQWNASACTVEGGPAADCAFPLPLAGAGTAGSSSSPRLPAPAPPPPDRVPWTLWTVSPALPSGYVLLGEAAK